MSAARALIDHAPHWWCSTPSGVQLPVDNLPHTPRAPVSSFGEIIAQVARAAGEVTKIDDQCKRKAAMTSMDRPQMAPARHDTWAPGNDDGGYRSSAPRGASRVGHVFSLWSRHSGRQLSFTLTCGRPPRPAEPRVSGPGIKLSLTPVTLFTSHLVTPHARPYVQSVSCKSYPRCTLVSCHPMRPHDWLRAPAGQRQRRLSTLTRTVTLATLASDSHNASSSDSAAGPCCVRVWSVQPPRSPRNGLVSIQSEAISDV